MKKALLFLSTSLILLLLSQNLQAATKAGNRFVTMNIPETVIEEVLAETLPLTIDGASDRLEGTITIVGISNLRLVDDRIFCHLDLSGNDLRLATTVADQVIRLKLGSARIDFDSETEIRFDAGQQILFIKPFAKGFKPEEALQNGDIGKALLVFLNGREFALALDEIQPIITEATNKTITINTRIAAISSVPGALQFSLQPIVSAVLKKQ